MNSRSWGIALVGCGTVGGGTASILWSKAAELKQKTGLDLQLKAIVDVSFEHARKLGLAESLFKTSLDEVLADPEIAIVIELVGGIGFARSVIEKALQAGKHVVTANKALLATHGRELFALARSQGLAIGFEASCAGGIPIVRILSEHLLANQITGLYGVVNGTCNYILTQMGQAGLSYEIALRQAQDLGFAEANPALDVSGMDSAHKLSLLASIAFGSWVDFQRLTVRGLDQVRPEDHQAAASLGATIKLLVRADRLENGLALSVEPTAIAPSHPLAALQGSFNGVSVYGSEVGHLFFQGRGAGARPTASAVVADLIGIATGSVTETQSSYHFWPDQVTAASLSDLPESQREWMLYGSSSNQVVLEQRLTARGVEVSHQATTNLTVVRVVRGLTAADRSELQSLGVSNLPWFSGRAEF